MVSRRRIQEMLRKIGRDARLSGADRIPEELEKKLRARMTGEVNIPEKRRKPQEVIPMLLLKKVTIPATVVALAIGAIVLVVALGTKPMPTFAQLVEASEAAAAKVNSLRIIGREPYRGEMREYEMFVKNPVSCAQYWADGSYFISSFDASCLFHKGRNVFIVSHQDMRADLRDMGLDPNTSATSLFRRVTMLRMIEENLPAQIRVQEAAFKGKPAYKAVCSHPDAPVHVELYFEKASGLLVGASWHSQSGPGAAEVVEINPELDESLFSMEPPPGATVIDKTKEEASGN